METAAKRVESEICLLKLRLVLAKSRDVLGTGRVRFRNKHRLLTISNDVFVFVWRNYRAVMSLEDNVLLI
jgi:hypothetical protein